MSGPELAPGEPHGNPNCLVCGPDNPAGFGMVFALDGDELEGRATLDHRHEGAPGIAHGGALAAIFDEVLGMLARVRGDRAVTASLTVEYRAPVPTGRELRVRGRIERAGGRKLHVRGELHVGGRLAAEAHGLWIVVADQHFIDAVAGPPGDG
jgi:acyl-coenzyme A thioesterase PaaI-like protein